jgi:hypothetical protein
LALKLGIQTFQILTKDDEVCIPSLSSILLALDSTDFLMNIHANLPETSPLFICPNGA